MSDIFAGPPGPDPLDALLAPPGLPADGAALRDGLRERTVRVLRSRRRWRRLAVAASLAACVSGPLLAWAWWPRPSPPVVQRPEQPAPREQTPAEPPAPSPLALEWRALEAEHGRGALYRQAGDRYLDEEGDLESALRCYDGALEEGGAAVLTITSEDSWLLMAIKEARQKETMR